MVTCNNCFHCCVCPIADGVEYADEQHIRDDCEYFVDTADVVPKSEYDEKVIEYAILDQECGKFKAENEKLQGDLEVWKQNRFNIFQRLECYEMARQKVAREIFEDILNIIRGYSHSALVAQNNYGATQAEYIGIDILKLKKKYTEEKE